jgi:hypothetical protein
MRNQHQNIARQSLPQPDLKCSSPQIERIAWGYRKVPLSHGRHHIGRTIPWPGHPAVVVESLEERLVVQALAKRCQCTALTSQPVTVWYSYRGRPRRYTPDLMVAFAEIPLDLGRLGAQACTLIEVKPHSRSRLTADTWALWREVIQTALSMPLILLCAESAREAAP